MAHCAGCGERVAATGERIELAHHHEYMCFESTFCGADCAVAYLTDGLD